MYFSACAIDFLKVRFRGVLSGVKTSRARHFEFREVLGEEAGR